MASVKRTSAEQRERVRKAIAAESPRRQTDGERAALHWLKTNPPLRVVK